MLARGHVLGGAAFWLAGSAVADHYWHYHQSPAAIAVGTAMCAGGALLPDLDLSGKVTSNEGGATVARAFGVPGLFVAECCEKASLAVRNTVRMKKDGQLHNGHRSFLHTLPAAALASWGATELCTHQGRWGSVGLLFVCFGLAFRGLFPDEAKRLGWLLASVLSGLAALGAYHVLPTGRGFPLLGAAVGAGWVAHLLCDLVTSHGLPLAWPIPLWGRMWRNLRIPLISCDAGSRWERWAWSPAFTLVAAASVVLLAHPAFWPTTTHPTPAPAVAHHQEGKPR